MLFGIDPTSNRLLAGARTGRRPSYLVPFLYWLTELALTLMYASAVGVAIFVVAIMPRLTPEELMDPEAAMAAFYHTLGEGGELWVSFPTFLLIIALTWFWVRVIERRPFHSIGLRTARPAWEWLRGVVLGAGLFGLSVGLIALRGDLHMAAVMPAGLGPTLRWALLTLVFFLIQGPAEEIMARGYLMPALAARGGLWVGIAISALIFAIQHLLNAHITILSVVNLVLFGILAALYALREEGLWGVFGLHTIWNWMQGPLLGLPVSGAALGPAPVLDLQVSGPAWWGGGAFGPEGGLVVTLPTLAGILILLLGVRGRAASPAPLPAAEVAE